MVDESSQGGLDGIAIVGMSVRLPGASDLEAFWKNLRDGVESIRFFTDRELLDAGVEPASLQDPNYVKARGALDDVDLFDAAFFGFTPREAETMDPQHRLFLEEAWTALEHAGCNPGAFDGAIGVFAGANLTGYLLRNLAPNDELVKRVGPLQIRIRNDKDFLATLVAYKLDLKGPAINVQTACSSSLVGVALACQSLLSYQCDMALAGGVSVTVPHRSGYLYQEGVYAPDGHCRAFDARARGTVLGDGVAVVVLKRLEDALADGDTVHAVIRGFATNNDGALKLDYTAPSVDGQAEVIAMAQSLGEVDPETVTYVEAHGTGTPLGDPIEITALSQAFRRSTEATGFCGIGSVKTNIGHLDAAAGTSGLVKTVLALTHGEIPATLHFTAANPQLDLAASPFYVVDRLTPWEAQNGVPRRAGVSSFGVGGTNAHVVVEEAPAAAPIGPSRPWQLLALSARTEGALGRVAERLADFLESHPGLPLADVAFTLARGRRAFEAREILVCREAEDAVAVLRGGAPRRVALGETKPGAARPVAFLFPGIGDHYAGMGRDLYENEPVFREAVDRSARILRPLLGLDVREVLWPTESGAAPAGNGPDLRRMLGRGEAPGEVGDDRLSRTVVLHPALFVIEYALAQQWMAWGVRPGAMIGYSIGEYVAACLAGVFTLEGALRLVAERARIIEGQPEGAMLAVSLPETEVAALLAGARFGSLSVAAVNGPAFCVVAGSPEEVAALEGELARRSVVHRRLKARHPFHSQRLEAALPGFRSALAGIALGAPEIPFLSNVTGTWITPEQATDPGYWAEHMCRTVRFGDEVDELLRGREWILLEVGPGQSLTSIALQSAGAAADLVALASLPHEYEPQPAQAFLLHNLGRLWTAGVEPDWKAFFDGEERCRIPLPTYPFERRRYWVEPVERQAALLAKPASLDKKPDPADWFYVPVWRQEKPEGTEPLPEGPWLVLADETGLGRLLAADLAASGREVVTADPGEDLEALIRSLAGRDLLPRHVVHLWSVPAVHQGVLDRGFYSLLAFARAWGSLAGNDGRELSLVVVSSGAFEVTGEDDVEPQKATLAGPCRGIPQEYPGIDCRQIDLPVPRAAAGYAERWAAPLRAEIEGSREREVALRGRRRWVRRFEPVRLPEPAPEATRLRRHGVYVITGGLGGLGLTLAGFLAERFAARLVLVGRSAPGSRQVRRIREIEAAGAQILVCRGDVTRREDMEEVRRAALERFGAVHGVIHAAGQPPGGLIQLKTREAAWAVLAPKVEGTRILDEVFGGPGLDFLLLCSSLTALTGTLGLVDHAAANAFLDAWAQKSASQGGTRVVSVNWDTWLEVGQAAEAGVAARLGTLLDRSGEAETEAVYPHWERRAADEEEVLLSTLSSDGWLVAEHRLRGVGLVPGTAYLEMVRYAVEDHAAGRRVKLRGVVFSQPCTVEEGGSRTLRVRLGREDDGFAAVVESAASGEPWQEHARASVELLPGGTGGRHDFGPAAGLAVREIRLDEDREADWVEFGERWRGLLRELRAGEGEGWARLALPEAFRDDLDDFVLHPALTDVATGLARLLGEGAYLPASYDEVTVHDRLPAEVQTHFRLREGSGGADTLVCDVTVGDSEGRVLLEARGYTLRRLAGPPLLPAPAAASRPGKEWSLGILPREGAEAFGRLLALSFDEPQVVVSVRDFAAVLDKVGSLTGARAAEHMALLGREGGHRSATRAPYVAPRNSLEAKLAELYQDMLGAGQVGIHDNFFDLGGNSLVATQLLSRLRELFEVEIALRALFEAPTVAELGVVIVREQAAGVDEDELAAALQELKQMSREELLARLASDAEV
jgi:phthiocerol/phenolphthiocerol synthesis type-I polyketide synthase E